MVGVVFPLATLDLTSLRAGVGLHESFSLALCVAFLSSLSSIMFSTDLGVLASLPLASLEPIVGVVLADLLANGFIRIEADGMVLGVFMLLSINWLLELIASASLLSFIDLDKVCCPLDCIMLRSITCISLVSSMLGRTDSTSRRHEFEL